MQVDVIDRESNIIIFGVTEDRDILTWLGAVENILNFVACQGNKYV